MKIGKIISTEFSKMVSKPIRDKDSLTEAFEKKKIFCMAAKEDDDEMHFYYYCQEKTTGGRIIFDLHITDRKDILATIKASNSKSLEDFTKYLGYIFDTTSF